MLLDRRVHPIQHQAQFYKAAEILRESGCSYAFELRQLTSKVFTDDIAVLQDRRISKRLVQIARQQPDIVNEA